MPGALAFRYGRALADLALAPGAALEPAAIAAEIELFGQALAECRDLQIALESPSVPPARKRAVVARLAGLLPFSDLVRRFLCVLIDHRRTELIHEVREAFEAVVDERLGIVRAEVVSARQLAEPARQEIVDTLTLLTRQQARVRFRVEDGLIGGVVARIGSTVYDGSIRGQLQGLQQKLAGAGS
jgi:F-type H+-transporting ATPase subunit delta